MLIRAQIDAVIGSIIGNEPEGFHPDNVGISMYLDCHSLPQTREHEAQVLAVLKGEDDPHETISALTAEIERLTAERNRILQTLN